MLMDAAYRGASSPTQMVIPSPADEGQKASSKDPESPVAGTIIEVPGQFDVMMGRGIGPNEHPGNKRYRTIVHSFQPEYLATKKRKEKEKIARKAIRNVKANGARFLKQVGGAATSDGEEEPQAKNKKPSKRWVVVEKEVVLEKTKQALRFVGHYHKNRKAGGGSSDEGDRSSSDGGTSSSKIGRPVLESKGQDYAVGAINRGAERQQRAAVPPPMGGVQQQMVAGRFPGEHHLHPASSAVASLPSSTLPQHHLAAHHSHVSSSSSSSSLHHQQQVNREIAHLQERLRRAVAAGANVSLDNPLVGDDISSIALLLERERALRFQPGAGDTNSLLLERLARSSTAGYDYPLHLQPGLLNRLLLMGPHHRNVSSLSGTGTMSDLWGQGVLNDAQSSLPSSSILGGASPSSRSIGDRSLLRSLMLPASSRDMLPLSSSTTSSRSGLGGSGAGGTALGGLHPNGNSQRGLHDPVPNPGLAAQNSALLSLLRQRQGHAATSDIHGGINPRPSADLLRYLSSNVSAERNQHPSTTMDRASSRRDDEDGKTRE